MYIIIPLCDLSNGVVVRYGDDRKRANEAAMANSLETVLGKLPDGIQLEEQSASGILCAQVGREVTAAGQSASLVINAVASFALVLARLADRLLHIAIHIYLSNYRPLA